MVPIVPLCPRESRFVPDHLEFGVFFIKNQNSCILTCMNAASALILTVLLSACQMKHTFDRPPMEKFSAKDFNRNQVPGTKLFIATAPDYIPDPVKGLFRKDAH